MDKLLVELQATFRGMTLDQRLNLKIILGLRDSKVDSELVQSLVDLGLVVKVGDTYRATAAGGYIARLY